MDTSADSRDLRDPSEAQLERWRAIVHDRRARPEDLVEVFLDVQDSRLQLGAITHANMTDAHVVALIESGEARGDRALSMTNRQDILARYACSANPEHRGIVAFNANTSAGTAELLAKDPHPAVRVNAALCPQLSSSTRAFLARHDPDLGVREEVFTAMTDVDMRMAIEGARIAMTRGVADDGSDDQEIWVLCMPVLPFGDVE